MKLKRCTFGKAATEIDVALSPLPDATLPERFALDPPPSTSGAQQPFGGPAQNSRLGANLGAPTAYRWVQGFEVPLYEGSNAHSVMQHGDRVLVQARNWQLFDLQGARIRVGLGGPSPLALCAEDGTFRLVSGDGTLDAYSLSDGEARWSCGAPVGDGGPYPVLAVSGRSTLLAGGERRVNPEAENFSPEFAAQWIDPTDAPDVSAGGILRNARRSPALVGPARGELLGAVSGDRAALLMNDLLLLLDPALNVLLARSGAFVPRAVSFGGAGRLYVVVSAPAGPALWMINAQGERVSSTPLPSYTRVPPIITSDHRIFVTTDAEILAFSPVGELLWRVASPSKPPRASATADGWLLASVGEELRVFDAEGRSAVLSYSVGRPFVTAPILTTDGAILVATTASLVSLFYEQLTYATPNYMG